MIVDTDTGRVLLSEVRVAGTFLTRFAGLMGARGLAPGEGLFLPHCGSIHTFFMRFPIDVAYLDRDMRVVAMFPCVRPWRVVPGVTGGVHTLELAAGALEAGALEAGALEAGAVEVNHVLARLVPPR